MTSRKIPLITLTTDFGLADEYVGVMKGVILGFAPSATIVDLCHQIAAQDVCQASRLLAASFPYFPAGSLHAAVVDPGVGGGRRIILAKASGHLFLAPDNGLLTEILAGDEEASIRQVTKSELFLATVSRTFHGRDIFAPIAGRLAAGLDPSEVGPEIESHALVAIDLARPALDLERGTITGRVTGRDHFGNLLTNIRQDDIALLLESVRQPGKNLAAETPTFAIAGRIIRGLSGSYGEAAAGQLLALIGSRGVIEIAANQASAALLLAPAENEPVTVSVAAPFSQ